MQIDPEEPGARMLLAFLGELCAPYLAAKGDAEWAHLSQAAAAQRDVRAQLYGPPRVVPNGSRARAASPQPTEATSHRSQ